MTGVSAPTRSIHETATVNTTAGQIAAIREQTITAAVCLDVRGAAALLSVSPRTVRSWAAAPVDPLPAITNKGKLLFRLSQITAWLDRPRGEPVPGAANDDLDGILERHSRKLRR